MDFQPRLATAVRQQALAIPASSPAKGAHARQDSSSDQPVPRRWHPWFDVIAVVLVFAAYTATLRVANDLDAVQAVLGGLANTVPVVLFGGAARWLIMHRLIGRNGWLQAVGHLCLGAGFSLLSLWLLFVLLGMLSELSLVHFKVAPFTARGNAWQLLENATTYAAIAVLGYLQALQSATRRLPDAAARSPVPAEQPQAASPEPARSVRHFIRRGEDILPVDLDRIVCITGAGDYSEVSTLDRTHLLKMTLTEFSAVLDPARFLRVHRSAIVNLECVERAESAGGGRMLVHMSNGRTIKASRAGSQLLRTRVI